MLLWVYDNIYLVVMRAFTHQKGDVGVVRVFCFPPSLGVNETNAQKGVPVKPEALRF